MSRLLWIAAAVVIALLLLFILFARLPNIRQKISGLRGPVVILAVILLAGGLVAVLCQLLLPRGVNSLFSDDVTESVASESMEAETEETEAAESKAETEAETEEETGFSLAEAISVNQAGDQAVYITVAKDTRQIGTASFSTEEELRKALKSLQQQTGQFVLVDDYAYADTYRETVELLKELEISFSQVEKQ